MQSTISRDSVLNRAKPLIYELKAIMNCNFTIRTANINDLENTAVLFNQYRMFYGKVDDINLAREFLRERIQNKQSVIFIAELATGGLAAFAQLYPCFSSVSAKSAWILNDLYVAQSARKIGAASALISAIIEYGKSTNSSSITLQTAVDNDSAQALYKKFGFIQEQQYLTFNFALNEK